jgi:hypothetical protein
MASIGDLVISLRADIASFRTGMDQANKSLSDVKSQFQSAKQAASDFVDVLEGFLASREVVRVLTESAEATRNWAEQLSTFQGLAGLSSTAAATLAGATKIAGVNTDVVASAMSRLATIMATHPEKLVAIGVASSVAALRQMTLTDAMKATISALDQYKAGTDRAEAAGSALGKGAEAWVTQLDKLGPELKAANWAETEALIKGLGLAMENGKAVAADWARAEGQLQLELLGVENQIGSALLPILKEFGGEIAKLAKDGSLKQWAEDAGVVIKALATDAELAAKAIGLIASAIKASGEADVAVYNRVTGQGRQSILKPFTPSPNGGFVPPDQRGALTGTNAPGAGDANAPPDGTKTFNVLDAAELAAAKALAAFNLEYEKSIANYRQDLDYQQQLKTAYTEGAAAVRQLQVDHAGELAVYKLLDEAEAKHVQVSDQMLESARLAGEADENAKLMASEQKTVTDALAASIKKQDEAMRALVDSADALTPKEQKLADTEGLLIQAFDRGLISADQFNQKLKALEDAANGSDKGFKELTSGLSTDLTSLIGKMTDFTSLLANKKGGQTIFSQLTADANSFVKSLQDLLLKLLVINPLLNALGLGDQGNGKQLPTLLGSSGGSGGGFDLSSILGGLGKLFGLGGGATGVATSAADVGLSDSDLTALLGAGAFGFANGGDFVVGGNGGVDSSLVAFKATPGEKVSVGQNAERGGSPAQHHYYMPMTVVTPDANSFLKSQDQIVGEGIRQMKKHAGRYA